MDNDNHHCYYFTIGSFHWIRRNKLQEFLQIPIFINHIKPRTRITNKTTYRLVSTNLGAFKNIISEVYLSHVNELSCLYR
jgi:hypothetical protein